MVEDRLVRESATINRRTKQLQERLENTGIEFYVDIFGRIVDGELELDGEVVPVIGGVEPTGGDGTITVTNSNGAVIESVSAATAIQSINTAEDGQSQTDDISGVASVSRTAARVEVAAPDGNGTTRTATFNPTTDPIRKRSTRFPASALSKSGAREELLNLLEKGETSLSNGNIAATRKTLQTLQNRLEKSLRDEYEYESQTPSKDELLSVAKVQQTRLQSENNTDTSEFLGLIGGTALGGLALGGVTLGGLGLYAKRQLDNDGVS